MGGIICLLTVNYMKNSKKQIYFLRKDSTIFILKIIVKMILNKEIVIEIIIKEVKFNPIKIILRVFKKSLK